jgi:AraC family transcriptional regulator of adaptative response/methylated-DNA-[protein]-cysteine methyltransferase
MIPSLMPSRREPTDPTAAWQAVVTRDRTQDGRFVFGVRTTRIYCRPSCPARRPNPENVAFFASPDLARAGGFRACRRCKPDQPARDPVALAHQAIEGTDACQVTLTQLAKLVEISPSHLQRRFKARYGMSPRVFQQIVREQRFRAALQQQGTVSRATYDAGFSSSSRVYEQAGARFGMTPGRLAKGGSGIQIRYAIANSPYGRLLTAVTDRGVCSVLLGRDDETLIASLAREFPNAARDRVDEGADSWLADLVAKVAAQLRGDISAEPPTLDLIGTAFQQRVWRALVEVPRGQTRSYQKIAAAIGQPTAARAVASAIARNRIAVVVPCHRVIREDGSVGGYRWGVPMKRQILADERR